ncbi:MAG: hypothetical protein ACRD1K_08515 [Acidimicrobiales bacterium]
MAGRALPPAANWPGYWLDPLVLATETRGMLHEDGGVRPLDDVTAALADLAVGAAAASAWLARQPAALVESLVVSMAGSPVEVAERLLSATGVAMDADELCERLTTAGVAAGRAIGAPELARRLRHDGRFVEVGVSRSELAEWGVRSCLDASAVGRRAWLRVEIDQGVLSGAGGPVPVQLLLALGVDAGARRAFATRYGPVALDHHPAQPTRGSLRPVALAARARLGDTLLLGFDPHDAVLVELVATHETR